MPIVLVHGNPETEAIWDDLRRALARGRARAIAPGFGAPAPDGFDATSDAYVGWLAKGHTPLLCRYGSSPLPSSRGRPTRP